MAEPETPARRHIVRVLILAGGWLLVALGIVGLFLPFLQGILFLLAGLSVLSLESRKAREFRDRMRRKHPGPDRILRKITEKARSFFRRKT